MMGSDRKYSIRKYCLLLPAYCLLLSASCLLSSVFCLLSQAQVAAPRGKDAAVYRDPDIESQIVAQVEAGGQWQLQFAAADIVARLPTGSPDVAFRFLLPARDTGMAVMALVRGPGRNNEGWVEPEKIVISPASFWKLPSGTTLFVPMKLRQLPPIRVAALPPGLRIRRCSYMLLVDPEGKVAGLRALGDVTEPALEAALRQFRFAPFRVDGEPTHVLLALRADPLM